MDGQDLDDADDLRAGVLELVVGEVDAVDLAFDEVRDHAGRGLAGEREAGRTVLRREIEARDPRVAAREVLVRLAADERSETSLPR